jgi:hypothetical protein
MNEFLIWTSYLAGFSLSMWRIRYIRPNHLSFSDGLLIGQLYYISLPMFFILMDGYISSQFIMSEDYYPFIHVETTSAIIVSIYYTIFFHIAAPSAPADFARQPDCLHLSRSTLFVVAALYFISTVISFLYSGLFAGGHWHAQAYEALSSNGLALLAKHVSNFARAAIFGVMVFCAASGAIRQRAFLFIGTSIVLCDLFLTFNRITAAYFIIAILIIYRQRPAIMVSALISLIFVLPYVSNLWPVFRGLATRDGYTLQGLLSAAQVAVETSARHSYMSDFTNGVFESINIPVLNYIVQHQGGILNVLPGTIYLRSLTFFLPSLIWSDRPEVFATTLGTAINYSTSGAALNSTFIGEPYANFGAWWPVAMLPMYLALHLAFLMVSKQNPSLGGAAAFCGIALWRFDMTVGPIMLVMSLVVLAAARIEIRTPPRIRGGEERRP